MVTRFMGIIWEWERHLNILILLVVIFAGLEPGVKLDWMRILSRGSLILIRCQFPRK